MPALSSSTRRQLRAIPRLTIAVVIGLTCWPSLASAQLSRVGNSLGLFSIPEAGALRGNDVGYDPVNNVYLVAAAYGYVRAAWTDPSGAIVAGTVPFNIGFATGSPHWASYARVAYSPDVNGGNGGFLVTWHQNDGTSTNHVHAALIAYPGTVISADQQVSDDQQGGSWWEAGAPIAYSRTSHKFLVAWQTLLHGIQGRFVDLNGAPSGSIMPFENQDCTRDPGLAWNPATDDFGLSEAAFCGGSSSGSFAGFRRIAAATGALSPRTTFGYTPTTFITDIVANPSTHHFVMGYSAGGPALYGELDETGTLVSTGLIGVGTYDSLGMAFNAASGSILAVGQGNGPDVFGIELNGAGAAIGSGMVLTNGGGSSGSFYPRSTARQGFKQWNISYSRQLTTATNQIVQTGTSLAGPTAPVSKTAISIDTPTVGASVRNTFFIGGWAIDKAATVGTGVDSVHVWAIPANGSAPIFAGAISSFINRDDVASAFGANFDASGWGLTVTLPDGSYTLTAYPHSAVTGTFGSGNAVAVTVEATTVRGALDLPLNASTLWQKLFVSGWAIDHVAGTGTGVDAVHVWAYPNPGSGQSPVFVGVASYGGARPDVAGYYGAQFSPSGFYLQAPDLPAGSYRVVAYAHSSVTSTFVQIGTADVTIRPAMSIDQPVANATVSTGSQFMVSGWAVDRNATADAGIDVLNVWAFGPLGAQFLGAPTVGQPRPDVAAVLGAQFVNSGFSFVAPGLSAGNYIIVAYAHSKLTGVFNSGVAVSIKVQ